MRKGMKRTVSAVLFVMIALSAMSCGKLSGLLEETKFDAKGYVQAVLDAKYQQKYADYAEFIQMTEEEAKEQMTSEFYASLESQIAMSGMEASEEQVAEYVKLEEDLRRKVQYEVKEAVEDEHGNFLVEVVVIPVDGYSQYAANFETELQNAVNEGATEADYMDIFLTCFKESIENAVVLDEQTVELHVNHETKDNVKVFTVEDEDALTFDMVATGQ